jgi:hypothetical protein
LPGLALARVGRLKALRGYGRSRSVSANTRPCGRARAQGFRQEPYGGGRQLNHYAPPGRPGARWRGGWTQDRPRLCGGLCATLLAIPEQSAFSPCCLGSGHHEIRGKDQGNPCSRRWWTAPSTASW